MKGYIALGSAVVLMLVGMIFWFKGFGVIALIEGFTRGNLVGTALVLILIAAAIALLIVHKSQALSALVAAGTILSLLAWAGYTVFLHNYVVAKTYAGDQQTIEQTSNYNDRAPWVVANNFASRDQGDVIGDREDVHMVPNVKEEVESSATRYTTLVKERAFLGMGGYEAVQEMQMPNVGPIPSTATEYCAVPEDMDKKTGAFFPWHNLSWSISAKKPTAHWDEADKYAYCDAEGNPVVVVPLWQYSGWVPATRVPDGAAVYRDSKVEILNADQLDEIEGPTYPRSIAEKQRNYLNASGSLGDWYAKNTGFDLTEKDEEDSNADNASEFTMISAAGDSEYVTPLTPKGDSQSIVAIGSLPATQNGKEERADYTINTETDLSATSTIAQKIRESSVKGDSEWTTRWANGMVIYEMLPARDGHWVASIGQGQAVSYRADISPDGSVDVTITDSEEQPENESTTVTGDKPLADMSEDELLSLINEAVTELQEN